MNEYAIDRKNIQPALLFTPYREPLALLVVAV